VGRAWAICHRPSDRRCTARELENTFARNLDVEMSLVYRENFFLFTPMLHEVAASDLNLIAIVNPIRRMLKRASFFEGDNDKQ
jgi:NADH:ubiquinone reductase (H+-translocating)